MTNPINLGTNKFYLAHIVITNNKFALDKGVFQKYLFLGIKLSGKQNNLFYNLTFPNHQIPPCERNNKKNGKISSQTITFKAFNVINKFRMYVKN